MQRFKRTIKRMVTIGTGVAMLGATMAGAVAQDLANYPQPFVDANGVFNTDTTIVIGLDAAASDTLGAIDIATQLQFDAKTPVPSGEGKLVVAGGVTEDIPIGIGIANDSTFAIDWQLDDGDIESFIDTEVTFQSDKYNIHDEALIGRTSPVVETSLTSTDDDYETNLFMEAKGSALQYYIVFDEPINISKTTSTDSFEVKFLGKNLKITGVDIAKNQFTASVGSEFFMDAGDTVTVEGKKVTLVNVGEGGSVVVDVDGVLDTISSAATRTINGIEIKNDDTFYTNEKSERSASLIIGTDAVKTYKDGDAYVGEDEDDPNWVWNFNNLGVSASTVVTNSTTDPGGPFIGVKNDFVKIDDTHDPAGIGECYDFPNNYVSVCFDSLTVADDNYLQVTMEYDSAAQTSKSGNNRASSEARTIRIYAPGSERFIFRTSGWQDVNFSGVNGKKVSEIWIEGAGTAFTPIAGSMFGDLLIYYSNPDSNSPSIVYAGNISSNATVTQILELNFDDSKQDNARLYVGGNGSAGAGNLLNSTVLFWRFTGDASDELTAGQDDIVMNWSMTSANEINALGITLSQEEADEVRWRVAVAGDWAPGNTTLGTKDEDHRTPYGVIIKDPKSNGASDQVILQMSGDQVQANVVVKGATTSVSGAGTSYIPADINVNARLDNEIAGSEANYDLILVGGPCANKAVEAVSALGVTCESARAQWSPGKAIIKMAQNGNKVALLVAGYNAIDTRMAAKVLKNYDEYDLSGTEVTVSGSLSTPIVE